ncbi:transcription elongation factor 1 homolog [Brachypodium distachyon]|uniref:Transcription elongation factor 1 homolog n=1 Tax=Brachypodium distachyon TaxID=15368 RepID=I1H0X2_BRADI|nr:transcription elongation factor 1 homolog [Brachypodium distachyon]KQK19545.1 hypothetical protein BRADI_1g48950v3 [Brachypodium distachyon]|eukprot:XP_003561081.1 transcription elongation factor 1 homolog [Brachypodium distachyon]
MGKRKAKAKAAPKKEPKLETSFSCPFCSHAGSVSCSIDLKLMIAEAACDVCKESYSTRAHALTEPVDVYGEWIDECEKANTDVVRSVRSDYRRRDCADDDDDA